MTKLMDLMNQMYKAGYDAGIAEGKRLFWEEIKKELKKNKEQI